MRERVRVDGGAGLCPSAAKRPAQGSANAKEGAHGGNPVSPMPRKPGSPHATETRFPPCFYSHSIVAGGFDEMSRTTRLTPGISLMIRLEIVSSRS
jgi:hypothetical protein